MSKLQEWGESADYLASTTYMDYAEQLELAGQFQEAASFAMLIELFTRPGATLKSPEELRAIVLRELELPEDMDKKGEA